ncbi:TetR/AcrR family transcriptional regulator [Gordonia rubripertincta]|uniref:TetR/AcrR family transcriptional regulator n=1 Tax=Gordonia rubripertincta TaxID=36822 RepID=A0AAW4G7W6_GORRU|nr:TetR/AcrR family transcriptional regulator [Gordonia rubripertincta]ASR02900.1 Transcriptional regulator, TetR family [Gordonia rubripertincta]MBM7279220.1 TetR/AcrR family transcriptional regulator [Gordonia rubripertincta]
MDFNEADAAEVAEGGSLPRPKRADAQRNVVALVDAAKTVFAEVGVDAPAKEITDLAGVGVGTLYRHFPKRSDLVAAVLEKEIDACVDLAEELRSSHRPAEALRTWVQRYAEFVGTKRGLASALHSGDPAFDALADHFANRLEPAVAALLAAGSDDLRADVGATEVLHAIALLCQRVPGKELDYNRRLAGVFVDGLYRRAEDVAE